MASFTDEIVGFNPYIQQIPVDDYVRVGLIKQGQYDQGVQKVQGYIDSVSGMDVVKPEHKEYLQQRLGQLQGEVSKIVQQDFSNQQLVNSVGSLTSKIVGDPIIQNAVASTHQYRMETAKMKQAQREGKSSPSNEYVYQRQVSNWLTDNDISSPFNAQYVPYTDVSKKVIDAFDKVLEKVPNSHLEDIPFVRGDNGQIVLDSDGKPKIDFAMIEKSYKGVTPERIEAILQSALNETDKRQLAMDGMYEYRGIDKTGMKAVTDRSYQHNLDLINDSIKGLLIDRQTNINDLGHVAQVDARIEALKSRAIDYQNRYKQDINSLNGDLESYKGGVYSQGWIDRFANGLSYSQESLTYKDNPYFKAAEQRRENDLKFQEFVATQDFRQKELDFKYKELDAKIADMALRREIALKKIKGIGDGTIPLVDPILEPVEQDDVEAIKSESFIQETNDIDSNIENQKMALAAQVMPDMVHVVRDPNGRNAHYEYNVEGKNPDTVKKSVEAGILKLKDAYDKDPNSVDDATKTYFKNYGNSSEAIQNRKFALNNLQAQADKTWSVDPLLRKVSPLVIDTPAGTVTMSPREQMEFNEKIRKVATKPTAVPGYGIPVTGYDDEAAAKIMNTPAEKYLYNLVKNKWRGTNADQDEYRRRLDHVQRTVNDPAQAIIEGRSQYLDNAVKDVVGVKEPVTFTIESFKSDERNRAQGVAVNILNSIEKEGKGNTNKFYKTSDIRQMLGKYAENTSYSLVSKGRDRYALRLSNTRVTEKPVEIDITKNQAEQLFGQGKFLDDFYNIRESLDLTRGTGKVTTDVRGLGKESAFSLDNGNLKKYGVKYHVEEPLKNGGYQVRLYIYDKASKQWLPDRAASFGQLLNEAQVTKFLSSMTDEYVDAIINNAQ